MPTCPTCDGSGEISQAFSYQNNDRIVSDISYQWCPTCGGSGDASRKGKLKGVSRKVRNQGFLESLAQNSPILFLGLFAFAIIGVLWLVPRLPQWAYVTLVIVLAISIVVFILRIIIGIIKGAINFIRQFRHFPTLALRNYSSPLIGLAILGGIIVWLFLHR